MTTEEVKAILRHGRDIDKRIKLLQESQDRAFAKVTSATQKISVTGVHGSTKDDAMAQYVAYSEQVTMEITKLQRIQTNLLKLISKVRRHDLQSVLQLYYIDCMTWEEVAVKMNYSWRWIMKLHGKALVEVMRIAERYPYILKCCK